MGLRTPKGDKTRGMLLTDTRHRIDVALVDPDGGPGGDGEVEVKLYKVDWRWWWERGEGDLAAWADANVHTPLQSAVVKVANGAGAWDLEIKYPEWGRYLLTAADKTGGHRAGKVVYVDWPGWAARGQKEGGWRGEHPRLRDRQAGVRSRGDGDPRHPHPAKGARPREPRVGLAGAAHRVDRGERGRDAVHLHRHGGNGAQRLRARDASPAPRADRQRPADPALRRRPRQGGEPADAPPARPRSPGGPAAGDDVHGERARSDRPAHGLHGGGGGRRPPRPDPLRDAQPVGPLLRPRGPRGAHLGPLRRGGRRLRRGDGADARGRRRRGGRLRQGPPRQPLPAHGPLPGALPPRGEGHGHAQDRDPAVRRRGARDGGGRARRRLRRRREVRLRAAPADAPRHAAARCSAPRRAWRCPSPSSRWSRR